NPAHLGFIGQLATGTTPAGGPAPSLSCRRRWTMSCCEWSLAGVGARVIPTSCGGLSARLASGRRLCTPSGRKLRALRLGVVVRGDEGVVVVGSCDDVEVVGEQIEREIADDFGDLGVGDACCACSIELGWVDVAAATHDAVRQGQQSCNMRVGGICV